MSPWLVVFFNCLFPYCYVQVSANIHQIWSYYMLKNSPPSLICAKVHKLVASLSFFMHVCILFFFALGIWSWINLQFAFSNRDLVVHCASLMPSCIRLIITWNNTVCIKYCSLRAGSLVWVPRTGEAGEKEWGTEKPHSSRQLSLAAPHPNKWACSQATNIENLRRNLNRW